MTTAKETTCVRILRGSSLIALTPFHYDSSNRQSTFLVAESPAYPENSPVTHPIGSPLAGGETQLELRSPASGRSGRFLNRLAVTGTSRFFFSMACSRGNPQPSFSQFLPGAASGRTGASQVGFASPPVIRRLQLRPLV